MSARLAAAILFAILCAASFQSCALAAPDPYLELQGLLTGDKGTNETLINEFKRGYEDGRRGRARNVKQTQGSDKTKAKQGPVDRALDQGYRRGFNLGQQDKAIEDEKKSKP